MTTGWGVTPTGVGSQYRRGGLVQVCQVQNFPTITHSDDVWPVTCNASGMPTWRNATEEMSCGEGRSTFEIGSGT